MKQTAPGYSRGGIVDGAIVVVVLVVVVGVVVRVSGLNPIPTQHRQSTVHLHPLGLTHFVRLTNTDMLLFQTVKMSFIFDEKTRII